MSFERKLNKNIIEELRKEQLYYDYLLPDIKEGKVFPAIRKNEALRNNYAFLLNSERFKRNTPYFAAVCGKASN